MCRSEGGREKKHFLYFFVSSVIWFLFRLSEKLQFKVIWTEAYHRTGSHLLYCHHGLHYCFMPQSSILQWHPAAAGIKSYQKTIAIAATAAISPCCHLESDTDILTVVPTDYRAGSFLRLWDSSIHLPHTTTQNCFSSVAERDYNLYFVQPCVLERQINEPWYSRHFLICT